MNLRGKRILITGAAGGIGAELAAAFLRRGAHVLLSGRKLMDLRALATQLGAPERVGFFQADLTDEVDRVALCTFASQWGGGIDVIVNNAGVSEFGLLGDQSSEAMQTALQINLFVPMELCRQMVPVLALRDEAHIVNIGSVFGSIGFAGNTVYCATKFGLRGFSEALRRELADTSIRVHYFAPRATRTKLNSVAVDRLNEALGNAVDEPRGVALAVVAALVSDRIETIIGWPEKFFARLNALLPRLVDGALRKKLGTIQQLARRELRATSLESIDHIAATRRVG